MKKPNKKINGIDHVQCLDCGEWYPYQRGIARCPEHHAKFMKKYNDRRVFYRSKYKSKDNVPASIKKELAGLKPFSGLFRGCTKEQIEAMIKGDVEALLRT